METDSFNEMHIIHMHDSFLFVSEICFVCWLMYNGIMRYQKNRGRFLSTTNGIFFSNFKICLMDSGTIFFKVKNKLLKGF